MKKIFCTVCLSLALSAQAGPIFDKACPQSNKAKNEQFHSFDVLRCSNPRGIVSIQANNQTWTGSFVSDENFFSLLAEPGASQKSSFSITYSLLNAENGKYLNMNGIPNAKSLLITVETDCINQKKRPIKFQLFSGNFASGQLLVESSPYSEWQYDPGYTSLVCVK